jgi:hypothetical protein
MRDFFSPDEVARRVAEAKKYYDSLPWMSVADQPPPTSTLLLVKFADGQISCAYWRPNRAQWVFAPYYLDGEPVSWSSGAPPDGAELERRQAQP